MPKKAAFHEATPIVRVTRRQYPVGQGCFHAGRICRSDDAGDLVEFRYIYDCGSTNQRTLRGAVESYRTQNSGVEALFVTHLDDDHVNGIDRLLSAVRVDTVYLPYVDEIVDVLEVVEAGLDGTLTASLVEARIEPQSWFGRRGVSRIVRVRASTDDGPPSPDQRGSTDDAPFNRNSVIAEIPVTSDQDPAEEFPSGVRVRDVDSGARLSFADRGQRPNWTLVPHVDPAPAEKRREFMNELRTALNLPQSQPVAASPLAAALRSDSDRKKLRNCYEKIFSGGSRRRHNRVSMSLYSGPAESGRELTWEYGIVGFPRVWVPQLPPAARPLYSPWEESAVGWIGTGDAELRSSTVRKAWQGRFRPFERQVSTFLLPHHGSTGNFHAELLGFQNLSLCVASAGAPSPYKHPGRAVVDEILNRGIAFHHVSQRAWSGLQEEIRSL